MNMFFSNTPYYLQYNRLIVRNTLLACSKLMKSDISISILENKYHIDPLSLIYNLYQR